MECITTEQCQHDGCFADAMECRIQFAGENGEHILYYYCSEHAGPEGFCAYCGDFWAGVARFDFAEALGGIRYCCEHCEDELLREVAGDDDADGFWCPYCGEDPMYCTCGVLQKEGHA